MNFYQRMGILPLKKRVNRDKCSFATKQRMFGVFAIDEILRYRGTWFPGSRTLCHPGNTRPNLHFFQYIQAYKPFADHVPPNTKQYQLILTKYQPVSSYTDPVPSSTTYNSSSRKAQFSQLNNLSFYDSFDESRTVYLV